MIELTELQHEQIAGQDKEPIPVFDPKSQAKYIMLRADLFERWKSVLDEDDVRLMAPLLVDLDPEDWEDLSIYSGKP